MISELEVAEPPGGWREPWPRVFELARVLPPERWALVGGLMVQTHALAARIATTRVTLDVDAAVRVEAGSFSYAEAAAALIGLGYTLDGAPRLAYRFARGTDVVDLMVADHERPPPRHARRAVMAISGGRQALDRVQVARFGLRGTLVEVPVPNLHGAVVLKAAAHLADSRDRARHLLDAVTLLACITETAPMVDGFKGSDRSRLRHLVRAVDEHPLVVAQAPADTQALARRTLDELRSALA